MKTNCLIIFATCALCVARADVNLLLSPDNLGANGWSTTITHSTPSYTYTPGAGTITQVADVGGVGAFKFTVPAMNTAWTFDWAGIGTANLAGTLISDISSIKIRTLGIAGDNVNNWQPPSITLSLSRGGATSDRNVVYVPWSSTQWGGITTGISRASGQWYEFDATTTGYWVCVDTGAKYSSWAAVKTAFGTARIANQAQLPLSWGYASQQGVNVGMCPLYDEQRALDSNVQGEVDWFEFTVGGVTTRYDLGVIPEPGTFGLVALGFGMLALRRKI